MNNKLNSNLTDADPFDILGVNFPFNIGPLQVVNSMTGDEKMPVLFFLVIVKFNDRTAHENSFYIRTDLPPFTNSLTILF